MNRTRPLIALVAAASILSACGSDSKSSSSTAASPNSTAAAAGTTAVSTRDPYGAPAASSAAPASGAATINVAEVGKLGKVLVGPDGRTLYLFEKDKGTTSACTGQCLANWPPFASPTAPTVGAGLDASKASTTNAAAANQVVYNGHLLYYFAADAKPGDTHGVGLPDWYAVNPDGSAHE